MNIFCAAHGAETYNRISGVPKCKDRDCPWNSRPLPRSTSRAAKHTIYKKDAEHFKIPFLLCCECTCMNPEAGNSSPCPIRNCSGPCGRCGVQANFPRCKTLVESNPELVAHAFSSRRDRIIPCKQQMKFDQIMTNFELAFDEFIPHKLVDAHCNLAKEAEFKKLCQDLGVRRAILFLDWSDKLTLVPLHSGVFLSFSFLSYLLPTFPFFFLYSLATGTQYTKVGLLIGVFVYFDSSLKKLVARTFVGTFDGLIFIIFFCKSHLFSHPIFP